MNPAKLPKRLFYIRGIIRNRLSENGYYYNHDYAIELLADAHLAGVSMEELEDIAKSLKVETWTNFRDAVIEATERASVELAGDRREDG